MWRCATGIEVAACNSVESDVGSRLAVTVALLPLSRMNVIKAESEAQVHVFRGTVVL